MSKNKPADRCNIDVLYNQIFKEGDDVMVITDEDEIDFGKLQTDYDLRKIVLHRAGRRHPKVYDYSQIVFMANDGFPLRKVASEGFTEEMLSKMALGYELREALKVKPTKEIVRISHYHPPVPWRGRVTYGDPFEVTDDVAMVLMNVGISDPSGAFEETLFMRSSDGASGLFWWLDSVVEMDVA